MYTRTCLDMRMDKNSFIVTDRYCSVFVSPKQAVLVHIAAIKSLWASLGAELQSQ